MNKNYIWEICFPDIWNYFWKRANKFFSTPSFSIRLECMPGFFVYSIKMEEAHCNAFFPSYSVLSLYIFLSFPLLWQVNMREKDFSIASLRRRKKIKGFFCVHFALESSRFCDRGAEKITSPLKPLSHSNHVRGVFFSYFLDTRFLKPRDERVWKTRRD